MGSIVRSRNGRSRNWLRTTVLVAVLLALGACTRGCLGSRAFVYGNFQDVKVSVPSIALGPLAKASKGPTNRYVAMTAKKGSSGALGFTRVPYDLWAPFDMSLEFGIYREDLAAGLGTGIFGIELDARGSEPLEFYGCFAQFIQDGLNVFVSKRGPGDSGASNVGQHFFPGARRVEVFVAHDGASLVFRARPADTVGAPLVIGSVPFVQQKPLNPGIGVFNVSDKSQIGFDRLEFGANGNPPAPVTPAEKAVSDLYRAAGPILHAHNLLDGTATPDMAGAIAALDDAKARIETARTSVEAIPVAAKQRSPAEQALARLVLVQLALGNAQAILAAGDPRKVPAVLRILECKLLLGLLFGVEPVLPENLFLSLPHQK